MNDSREQINQKNKVGIYTMVFSHVKIQVRPSLVRMAPKSALYLNLLLESLFPGTHKIRPKMTIHNSYAATLNYSEVKPFPRGNMAYNARLISRNIECGADRRMLSVQKRLVDEASRRCLRRSRWLY